jgi:hypothetical protein
VLIGLASLAAIDFAGFVTMVADPELTARVIPALAGAQILGFVVIGFAVVTGSQEFNSPPGDANEPRSAGKQWIPWLFGFLALLSFMRAGLALLYLAGEEAHRRSWVSPITGAVMGSFFLWLAILAGRSGSKARSKEETSNSDQVP